MTKGTPEIASFKKHRTSYPPRIIKKGHLHKTADFHGFSPPFRHRFGGFCGFLESQDIVFILKQNRYILVLYPTTPQLSIAKNIIFPTHFFTTSQSLTASMFGEFMPLKKIFIVLNLLHFIPFS